MSFRSILLVIALVAVAGCSSTRVEHAGTIVVEGTVQPLAGAEGCYLIEVGKKVSEKAFYQLLDTPERLAAVAGRTVSIRIRVDSAASGPCPVGTPAHVIDYLRK
jgi:hypothetical protein